MHNAVVVAARRALPVFGHRDRDTVADQLHRQPPGERTDPVDQRELRQPGTFTGLTVPAEASTGPALPIPTEVARPHSGDPVRSPSTSATARMTVSPSCWAGVARWALARIRPARSTSAGDLGAADVQGRHEVGVHQSQNSPSKLEN